MTPPEGPRRLLRTPTSDLGAHEREHGPLPASGGAEKLIAGLRASGLTGRGGAGFPTWRKFAAVAEAEGRPVVVANGAEGEPASAKDRTLLLHSPHLVLDGLQLAAQALGAKRAYLYVHDDIPLGDLLVQRRTSKWDTIPVTMVGAPRTFIAGEESAVIAAIEGAGPKPRDKQPRVSTAGLKGQPTLVQNVETLAHLALIVRHGPAWFRRQGTAEEPGTFLATLSGSVGAPGVYEAGYGVSLAALLAVAGGATDPLQAILVGGFHGAWVPASSDQLISAEALRPFGAVPGAGVVLALSAGACGLVQSATVARYLADQSSGQCGPCWNGLPRIADTLSRLAERDRVPGLAAEVDRLARLVTGRGACHHPDGTARFVRSTLRAFAGEVDRHLTGVCRADRG